MNIRKVYECCVPNYAKPSSVHKVFRWDSYKKEKIKHLPVISQIALRD